MGVPWNPEWEERITDMARRAAGMEFDTALADGRTMSQMTPGSIPSSTSTHKYAWVVFDTDAVTADTAVSATTGAWVQPATRIGATVESGGRPVEVTFRGSLYTFADQINLSIAIDDQEMTRTNGGLAQISLVSQIQGFGITWLVESPRPRFRVDLVTRRTANTNNAVILTYGARATLLAKEI